MSHYIQDNQAVVTTSDNKIMLFIKGGDNNVSSASSNRRCTDWHLQGVFIDKASYDNFIDDVLRTDVNGGSWQFNSLKNKSFIGFTEYDAKVYKRFDKALKSALTLNRSLEDVTIGNIDEYESEINCLLEKNNFSLNDQDGVRSPVRLYSYYDKTDEAKMKKVRKIIEYPEKEENKGYRDFCKTYEKTPMVDALMDYEFCEGLGKYRGTWNGLNSIPPHLAIPNENFIPLLMNNITTILDMWESDRELFEDYPEQIMFVIKSTDFMKKLQNCYAETTNEYTKSKYLENLEFVKSFEREYLQYVEEKTNKENKKIADAKNKFVEVWNGLIDDTYYKSTNERLPRKFKELEGYFKLGDFSLADVMQVCNDDFTKVIKNYNGQYKRNKKAIKDVMEMLVSKYAQLLDEKSVDEFCQFFGYSKPKKEKVNIKKADAAVNKVQATFDFAECA